MNLLKRLYDRTQDLQGFLLSQSAPLQCFCSESVPLQALHHNITGSVFLKMIQNHDDSGIVPAKGSQCLRLREERFAAEHQDFFLTRYCGNRMILFPF